MDLAALFGSSKKPVVHLKRDVLVTKFPETKTAAVTVLSREMVKNCQFVVRSTDAGTRLVASLLMSKEGKTDEVDLGEFHTVEQAHRALIAIQKGLTPSPFRWIWRIGFVVILAMLVLPREVAVNAPQAGMSPPSYSGGSSGYMSPRTLPSYSAPSVASGLPLPSPAIGYQPDPAAYSIQPGSGSPGAEAPKPVQPAQSHLDPFGMKQ